MGIEAIMTANSKEAVIVSPEPPARPDGRHIHSQMEKFDCHNIIEYSENELLLHRVHGIILGSGFSPIVSHVMRKVYERIGNKGSPPFTEYSDAGRQNASRHSHPLVSINAIKEDLIYKNLISFPATKDPPRERYVISFLVAAIDTGGRLESSEIYRGGKYGNKQHREVPAYAEIGPKGISASQKAGSELDHLSIPELLFRCVNEYSRSEYGPKKERKPKIAVISREETEILDQETSTILGTSAASTCRESIPE